MNFDRFRVQVAIEQDIGCTELDKWNSYLQSFKGYKVSESKKDFLLSELQKDASDIYFKAIFSLAEAVNGVYHGRHSWAVIKVYYAVFYFLRCSLATHGYAFIKNKGIYTLKIAVGESPVRRDCGTHKGVRISGDHKTTIYTYISLFKDTDILQTNTVNGVIVYDWLMELRNLVNYRERSFTEPLNRYFYSSLFDNNKMTEQIELYMKDDAYVYCFDEDHCSLAAPLKLAMSVRDQLYGFINSDPLGRDRFHEIEKVLNATKLNQSNLFKSLYDF